MSYRKLDFALYQNTLWRNTACMKNWNLYAYQKKAVLGKEEEAGKVKNLKESNVK